MVLYALGVSVGIAVAVIGWTSSQWTLALLGLSQVVVGTAKAVMTANEQRRASRIDPAVDHVENGNPPRRIP